MSCHKQPCRPSRRHHAPPPELPTQAEGNQPSVKPRGGRRKSGINPCLHMQRQCSALHAHCTSVLRPRPFTRSVSLLGLCILRYPPPFPYSLSQFDHCILKFPPPFSCSVSQFGLCIMRYPPPFSCSVSQLFRCILRQPVEFISVTVFFVPFLKDIKRSPLSVTLDFCVF